MGKELAKLQNDYPNIASRICYTEAFDDWTGITGFDLPRDEWVMKKAIQIGGFGKKKKK